MYRAVRCLAVTCLIASLAVLLVLAVSSRTIWGGTRGDAKATGSLVVKIKPKAAKQDGARWRVDGGAWQKSGKTVDNLDTGDHEVSFKDTPGWKTPNDKTVTVGANQQTSTTGKYKPANSLTIMLPGDVPLDLVWIPAGSFMMGAFEDEQDSASNESPRHQVTFANGFWMGKYEVTQAQWVAVMGSNPSFFTGDLSRPVDTVSLVDVHAFIGLVNALGQGTFHVPSEAQWEYACRAGTTTRFHWGNDPNYTQIGGYAWFNDNTSDSTYPVGQKLPNAWGLYDMSGNLYEWCEDWWQPDYVGAPTDGSAWVPTMAEDEDRVIRGGYHNSPGEYCRSADRSLEAPMDGYGFIGFRLAGVVTP